MSDAEFAERLNQHLASWVGLWPPPSSGVHVVGDVGRDSPTWDGSIRPLMGVGNGSATVISVRPDAADQVRAELVGGLDQPGLGNRLGAIVGVGDAVFGAGVFRTTNSVNPQIEDLGEWFDEQGDDLPEWLAPFNGPRLVARDEGGRPIAGVGIKVHDPLGYELSVVTEPAAEGRGLGRRLVATAARWVLDQGCVPTYLHAMDNHASARVAEAVGFADRGWTIHGLWPRS
ncbi:MAG: GNAT family N-acetyltransferase [Ilumatobacter sp.]